MKSCWPRFRVFCDPLERRGPSNNTLLFCTAPRKTWRGAASGKTRKKAGKGKLLLQRRDNEMTNPVLPTSMTFPPNKNKYRRVRNFINLICQSAGQRKTRGSIRALQLMRPPRAGLCKSRALASMHASAQILMLDSPHPTKVEGNGTLW